MIGRFRKDMKDCIEWFKTLYVDNSTIPSDLVMRSKIVKATENDIYLVKSKYRVGGSDEHALFLLTPFESPLKKTSSSVKIQVTVQMIQMTIHVLHFSKEKL